MLRHRTLADAGIEPSVGNVGGSYDNALAETNQRPLQGRGHPPTRSVAPSKLEFATLEWVDWFNNRRLLEPIDSIPPAEAESSHYASCRSHGSVSQQRGLR